MSEKDAVQELRERVEALLRLRALLNMYSVKEDCKLVYSVVFRWKVNLEGDHYYVLRQANRVRLESDMAAEAATEADQELEFANPGTRENESRRPCCSMFGC